MKNASVEETVIVSEVIEKKRRKSNRRSKNSPDCSSSSPPQKLDLDDSNEAIKASNVAFNSMPLVGSPMVSSGEINQQLLSKSCPDPRACEQSPRIGGSSQLQGSIFPSYWSLDAVNKALEKGEAFKALFRINAHNHHEAYCKIDGVSTDILINGYVCQNRAVDGDTVVIKLDPLSVWPKMKGFVPQNTAKPQEMSSPPEKSSCLGSSSDQKESCIAVEKLCTNLSSFPSKRPTGKVIALVEKAPVRDSIVGLLDVKGWSHHKEGEAKVSKYRLSLPFDEYIHLIPADPRFPKLIVPFDVLPGSIRERLERNDPTLESELVAAQIQEWGEGSPYPVAHITHCFGRGSELEPQINSILYQNSICDFDFSAGSLTCLPHIPWEVPDEEFQYRKDLRDLCVLTIDPSTATDLDDALSVESLPDGFFRVGVHIADVSYFVLPDTALDTEAQDRSTSVYMPQRKVPMLPPLLSENVGSLTPGVDRLAFSILWDFNKEWEVTDQWIGRTVIRSCCKLSYDHAQDIIDGTNDVAENGWPALHGSFQWSDVIQSVKQLNEISTVLRQRRFRNGALQLENTKPVFLFDEHGFPYDFGLSSRTGSNFLVEEFMILANITAAEIVSRAYPDCSLLRRHPEPNMRKLKEFKSFCSKHGMDLDISSSGQFYETLEKIKESLKDDSVLVDILKNYAIKPMQLATYFCTGNLKDDVAEWGHYGLAVPLYTHFTSPLRRYPDIVVHRAVAAALEAEELYSKQKQTSVDKVKCCFTGIHFDKEAAESVEGKDALSVAALKHGVPSTEKLSDIAVHCNERKLAARRVKDACDKLYNWFVLKKKEVFPCKAKVMNLGPRFMTIFISKLGIERRIHYDQIEGLRVEWLEASSSLIINLLHTRRGGRGNLKPLKEFAYLMNPCYLCAVKCGALSLQDTQSSEAEVAPTVFPLTVEVFSTIPVVLHAVGGDDGPLDIGARLYMTSYYK